MADKIKPKKKKKKTVSIKVILAHWWRNWLENLATLVFKFTDYVIGSKLYIFGNLTCYQKSVYYL